MGGIFSTSKERYINRTIELSHNCPLHLTESAVQEIMMNSQFIEKELYKLYLKF
jgi:hypothetical protein